MAKIFRRSAEAPCRSESRFVVTRPSSALRAPSPRKRGEGLSTNVSELGSLRSFSRLLLTQLASVLGAPSPTTSECPSPRGAGRGWREAPGEGTSFGSVISPPRSSRLGVRLLAFSLLLTACATAPRIALPNDGTVWFLLVEEDNGHVLAAQNADKRYIPASNRKLFAAATVANCLGLETQLHTEIRRDGDDLVIVGDGDPSLGSWRYERTEDFNHVADLLARRGITRVRDVVADVSHFDRVTIPGSWKWGNLGSDYAASVDAITWGESEIPTDRAVPDPGLHAAKAMRDALVSRGITVSGTTRVNSEPHAWGEKVADLPSPFVAQLLTTVLKNSHNLYAEMLFKRASNGTYDASFALERAFATREAHVDTNDFSFADGSGLSPDDLVTPRAIVKMLRWMNDPVRRGFWWATLAQPANEGTLRKRLVTLETRLRGKTGTINGVNALSGIIAMPDGHYRYFSMAANHDLDGDEAVRIMDAVVLKVAQ
jgi:D-alanyl-D-alanine carboxypeptidase/D-alanyl-D-alanine-endopeptidase (penicillin-binding protein 4)